MGVIQEVVGRVLVVTMDNPEVKNALAAATLAQLRELFESIAYRDPLPLTAVTADDAGDDLDIGPGGRFRPHVIVLRSSGDVFCAGAHLGEMKELGEADFQANLAAALEMGAMFRAVRSCPVPVVGRVHGPAFGGGVGLVAACDIVVAARRVRFAFTEVRLGVVPGVISPLVMDRIGQAATRHYFLTADPISSAEAQRLGLVDRVAASADLDEEVQETVTSILQGGPATLGMCKSLIEGAQGLGFNRSAELTARMIAEARTKPEAQAALKAFAAGESVPWQGGPDWILPPLPIDSDEGDS